MMLQKWQEYGSFLPVFISIVNRMLSPLDGTFLVYYRWQEMANNVAVIVVLIFSTVLFLTRHAVSKFGNIVLVAVGILLFILCLSLIFYIFNKLSFPGNERDIETLKRIWMYVYIAMVASVGVALTAAMNYFTQK